MDGASNSGATFVSITLTSMISVSLKSSASVSFGSAARKSNTTLATESSASVSSSVFTRILPLLSTFTSASAPV